MGGGVKAQCAIAAQTLGFILLVVQINAFKFLFSDSCSPSSAQEMPDAVDLYAYYKAGLKN